MLSLMALDTDCINNFKIARDCINNCKIGLLKYNKTFLNVMTKKKCLNLNAYLPIIAQFKYLYTHISNLYILRAIKQNNFSISLK